MQRVQREKLVVKSVQLTGYADRLNNTRRADYNQQLSQKRVATVKAALQILGRDSGAVRLPLVKATAAAHKSIEELLRRAGLTSGAGRTEFAR